MAGPTDDRTGRGRQQRSAEDGTGSGGRWVGGGGPETANRSPVWLESPYTKCLQDFDDWFWRFRILIFFQFLGKKVWFRWGDGWMERGV